MECMYCSEDSALRNSLMEKLCDLSHSIVYVFKDQHYYGRCVVAFKGSRHCSELFELTDSELAGYMKNVSLVARAVKEVSRAEKINYAIYGDIANHVHFHIVPKTCTEETWGGPFSMGNANAYFLDGEKMQELKEALIEHILNNSAKE